VLPTLRVNVLLPMPGEAMLAGTKVAVTPLGRPLADSATADWKPPAAAVFNVIVVEPRAGTVALAALAVSVKLGTTTVRLNDCTRVRPPPDAVIVTL
jgi:hypothetical protein